MVTATLIKGMDRDNPPTPIYWTVSNRYTGKVTKCKTARGARTSRDRQDNAYGGYVCIVTPVYSI